MCEYFLFMQSLQINMNISKHNIQLLMLNNRAQNGRHYNKNHINFTNLQFFLSEILIILIIVDVLQN